MILPKNYIECDVWEKGQTKYIGVGVLNKKSESNALFLFSEDHTYQYTRGEVLENFDILTRDGFKLNLEKVFE